VFLSQEIVGWSGPSFPRRRESSAFRPREGKTLDARPFGKLRAGFAGMTEGASPSY
jgi:hypothetical protein